MDPDLLPTPPEVQRIFDLISQGILPPADQFTIKEGEPTWSFAAIAKIVGVTKDEFRELLQGVGPRFENINPVRTDDFRAVPVSGTSFQRAETA